MQHGLDAKLKKEDIPESVLEKCISIVLTEWNSEITEPLAKQALDALIHFGWRQEDINTFRVPGAVELSLAARWAFEQCHPGAVIAIGCVVKGETPHFDYVCQSVTHGLTEVGLRWDKPVVFGVLTVNTQEQAEERVKAEKGAEFAYTAARMMVLETQMVKVHEQARIGFWPKDGEKV